MALEEYKRKRHFNKTPEPAPKLAKKTGNRFVVQKHQASHLHYDFRLEMDGVLKSWAVPKGPSLNPADKRLAMMVEDHPVSYIDFEGIIPPGNYGAGSVMVWDAGTWEPLPAEPSKQGSADSETIARAMLEKGDLKFRLDGEKLKGSFVLAHMRSRRPGSKGTEWLLIKHRDENVVPGYDIDKYSYSVLTHRTMDEIADDKASAEWQSNRPEQSGPTAERNDWLAKSIAIADRNKVADRKKIPKRKSRQSQRTTTQSSHSLSALDKIKGAVRQKMPASIHPMLATLVDEPFNDADWLYEIKWDGYRAIAFIDNGKLRLVSRNQNDLTGQFPELAGLPKFIQARTAILDGEIVALDEEGRSSFSLMQQRTGLGANGHRVAPRRTGMPIQYYAFDLLYLDGFSLMLVDLEQRKELLSQIIDSSNDVLRYSEHFLNGSALYKAAKERGLEGIVAKRRRSCYIQKRSREWLKIKITKRIECVIGGYTDPKGSREHFGSIVLGLYDDKGHLIPVGQAGTGFTGQTHQDMWRLLHKLETERNPFHGKVESSRRVHFVKPELVADIKFAEWTHEGHSGSVKLRSPVYEGLRSDKSPSECIFEKPRSALKEAAKAEKGEAA